jgi:ubiquinone/menaquinone biosynthesis C-methylase UbiE
MHMNLEKRFDPQKRQELQNAEREARWQPRLLLQRLRIQPGQAVLELGCGPGFWTLPLAELVGETGTIWALDVSQEMLDTLAERRPPAQVRLLRSELPIIDLPEASVDWIWAAFVVHEVEPLDDLMAEMRRVLRPGGRAAILEWRPQAEHSDGPPCHHRLEAETILDQFKGAGFDCLPQDWQHEDAYLILARLPE